MPKLAIMLVTYKRTEYAIRTVNALKHNLLMPYYDVTWHVADDGSLPEHRQALRDLLPQATMTDTMRRGAGASMNAGMNECLQRAKYILWVEDDWELSQPFNPTVCIELMEQHPDVGMVRLAYISPELNAHLVSGAGELWWRLHKGTQYVFSGGPSIRSAAFCAAYGQYAVGIGAGYTELDMCTKFSQKQGPDIVTPAWCTHQGIFAHIGTVSVKDDTLQN